MKVLVTGSRDFANMDVVWTQLIQVFSEPWGILIHGDCQTGADYYAAEWAKTQPDIYPIAIPAKWQHPGLGKGAGFARNDILLELDPDIVLAFYARGARNRGTRDCDLKASEKGKVVQRFWDQESYE